MPSTIASELEKLGATIKDDVVRNGSPCGCLTASGTKEKAYFSTKEGAVLYADRKLKEFGRQFYPYQCGKGVWHITTQEPASETEAKEENFAKAMPLAQAAVLDPVNHEGETKEKVKLLHEQGKGVKESARLLGLSTTTIYYHLYALGLRTPQPRKAKEEAPVSQPVSILVSEPVKAVDIHGLSLSAIRDEMVATAARLEELKAKEAHLLDHLRLKLFRTGDGVRLVKSGVEFLLTEDEVATLIDVYAAPEQEGQ